MLWAIAASALLAIVVVYVLAVWTVVGQVVDTRLMWAAGAFLEDATWTAALLDLISPASVLASLCIVMAAALAWRGASVALAAAGTVAATLIGSELLKHLLIRPAWIDEAANSLPSGHVSAVAAIGVAAYVAAPAASRAMTAVISLLAVLTTSAATMAAGWHRPSDAIASTLLALGVGAAVTAVHATARRQRVLQQHPIR